MCGRFTRKENFEQLAKILELRIWPDLDSRYNIAPSQLITCIRANPDSKEREYVQMRWGFLPSWIKDFHNKRPLINARAETVAEKPAFRDAFKKRRCLILADGFYEWKREKHTNQPYYIHFVDNRPFAFAGLWEHWKNMEGTAFDSCVIITTTSNTIMKSIHHRMPVILHSTDYARWLNDSTDDSQGLLSLLQPHPHAEMEAFPVTPIVNNPRNDSPLCLQT